MESASYVFSFRMVFFYLVTTGWIFDISLLCETSIQKYMYIVAAVEVTTVWLILCGISLGRRYKLMCSVSHPQKPVIFLDVWAVLSRSRSTIGGSGYVTPLSPF